MPAALPAFPFGVHLIISSIASHRISSLFLFCLHTVFRLRLPLLTSSSFLPFSSFVFLPSRLVSKKDNLFPSPPFQGKGPCIISRLRHPSLLFAPPPDALPCRRQQFHPSSAATYFVSSSTTLSFILISVSYSTTYRSLEDRLFQPILDCLVIRLVLPLPALSPKTTSPAPPSLTLTYTRQPPPPVDLPVSSPASSDGCHPVIENCTTLLTRGAVVYFGMFHCLLMSTTISTLSPSS